MTPEKMAAVSKLIRNAYGTDNRAPGAWTEIFLHCMQAKDLGILAQDLIGLTGCSQGIISRAVSIGSQTFNPETRKVEGADLFDKQLDLFHKHRVRIFLSKKGKLLAQEVEKLMA